MSSKSRTTKLYLTTFFRFLEILHLPTTTSSQVVMRLKATFARYGIPEVLVSDNGPQLASTEMKDFSKECDFTHVTSSPHFPQSSGHAERAVQIAKTILRQDDPLLALMTYRATSNSSTGASPAELLMGRKIRSTLPILQDNLKPSWPDMDRIHRLMLQPNSSRHTSTIAETEFSGCHH